MADSDQEMVDAAADTHDEPEETGPSPQELDPTKKTFRILSGSTRTSASFEFSDEDHTLGNALRHIIMKNPSVEFCGYSIPHPAEAKMHLRIQTYGDDAQDVLEKGLDDLMDLCDVVIEKFESERKAYHSKNGPGR